MNQRIRVRLGAWKGGVKMDFKELLEKRRSIRNFEDTPVGVELVMEMLKETTLAPTASNAQPCNFIIVMDRAVIKRISDDSKANLLKEFAVNPHDRLRMYVDVLKDEAFNVFYNAPCLVLVIGDKGVATLDFDTALTVAYLMFAATSRGLGTCWINLGASVRDPDLLRELGVSDECRIVAPIILGYPKEVPMASARHDARVLKVIPGK